MITATRAATKNCMWARWINSPVVRPAAVTKVA